MGMEGIKSDRPAWINKIERQFADDIKNSKDPTVNIVREYKAMEAGYVQWDDLAIRLALQKDPSDYEGNSCQRVVGNELCASQGDTIVYYKSDIAGGGSSNSNLLSRKKYLEMLRVTVQDSLKTMRYDFVKNILRQQKILN